MTPRERSEIIDEIVALAPKGLGLPEKTRKNLNALDDRELVEAHGKLKRVKVHAAASTLKRSDIGSKRAELASRREAAFARIARLEPNAAEVDRPAKDHTKTAVQAGALILPSGLLDPPPEGLNLKSALDIWNTYDRVRSSAITDSMRAAVVLWLEDFSLKTFGSREIELALVRALEGAPTNDFDQYFQLAIDRAGRDTLRILRNHLVHGIITIDAGAGDVVRLLAQTHLAEEALEPHFIGTVGGRIRETAAIDGLAKMRTFAIDYEPDVIITVSGGGKIVGDFIANEMKMPVEQNLTLQCRGKQTTLSGGWRLLKKFRRILLVDDIAGAPDLLCEAHRSLAYRSEGSEIQMVAFASTLGVRDQLIEEGHSSVFVAHAAAEHNLEVPWDRSGVYLDKHSNHVFGASGQGTPLRVAKAQLRRVSSSLMESSVLRRATAES